MVDSIVFDTHRFTVVLASCFLAAGVLTSSNLVDSLAGVIATEFMYLDMLLIIARRDLRTVCKLMQVCLLCQESLVDLSLYIFDAWVANISCHGV